MTLPNFLIIGAAKAGTTSLYNYLQQHPDVFLSTPKEPRFFALEGQSLNYQGPIQIINRTSITTWDAYQSLFQDTGSAKAIGEASTVYLYEPQTVERIQHYLGAPKLIAILRNPVSRAYSSYLHLVRDGQETLSFEAALEQEETRKQNQWPPLWHYRSRGYYFEQLQPFFETFGASQISIYLFEDLTTRPLEMMQEIFKFLDVDPSFIPDVSKQMNISGVPKRQWLSHLINRNNPVKRVVKSVFPQRLRKTVYSTLQKSNTGDKTPINPQLKQTLIDAYRADILKLESLIQRDLSSWLR